MTESSADLVVGPLLLSDGGQYRCEITYYSVSPACPPVHLATLTTIAPPSYARLETAAGQQLSDTAGPFSAGSEVELLCVAGGGRPAPTITWLLAGDQLNEQEVE